VNIHGFLIGLHAVNGDHWTIINNDFSDNYTDPDYGWGDGEAFGAVYLERVDNSMITGNTGCRVWNGLNLKYSNNNKIENNDFSRCTNVCLKMWDASNNVIKDNKMSHGIRIAPGSRSSGN
jgi:parallel beta-helix repeat protein